VFRKILMRALVAPVIGAVVVAGGIAYAEVGDEVTDEPPLEEEVVEDPAPEEEVTEEPAAEEEVTEDPAPEDEVVDDEVVDDEVVDDEVVEDEVVEDEVVEEHPDNHGKLVSETARNTPPGPGHGAAVSAVARSKSHPGSEDS
jgi:hypothetical protein